MSTRFLLSIFGVFVSLGYAQAQQVRPYPMEEKSLLWKAVHPEKKGEVYLFGTMHIIEKEYFYFPKKLQKLVEGSDLIVLELPGLPDPMAVLDLVRLKEGSFFDFFTSAQRDSILDWAQNSLFLDSALFCKSFGKMKPIVVAQMAVEMEFAGSTESYEMTIEKLAKERDIPLEGLETIEMQMGIFDALSMEDQANMVMENIRDTAATGTLKELEESYAAQDLDALYKLILESGGMWAAMEDEFLTRRNRNWLGQMPRLFNGKKVFVAVGAGHLGGPEGLIRLMEENGYRLSPVEI